MTLDETPSTGASGEPTVYFDREGCSCFRTMTEGNEFVSLCPDHEAERQRLNAASPSGFAFGAGLSGGWKLTPRKVNG